MVAASSTPVLTAPEVTDLLRLAERLDSAGILATSETEWAANTAVALGAVRVPSLRNGYRYEATVAGTTHATNEPVWPIVLGGTIVDSGVTWAAIAGAWLPTYDLNSAAAEGWRWKAAKLADRYAFGRDGARFDRQQAFEHALKMVDYYQARAGQYAGQGGSGTITLPRQETRVTQDPELGIQLKRWDGSGDIPSLNVGGD